MTMSKTAAMSPTSIDSGVCGRDLDCAAVLLDVCATVHSTLSGKDQAPEFDFDVRRMAVAINSSNSGTGEPVTAELDWAARLSSSCSSTLITLTWAFWRVDNTPLLPPMEVSFSRRRPKVRYLSLSKKRRMNECDDHDESPQSNSVVLTSVGEGVTPSLLSRVFDQATAFFTMLARYPPLTADVYRTLCGSSIPEAFLNPFLQYTSVFKLPDATSIKTQQQDAVFNRRQAQKQRLLERTVSAGVVAASAALSAIASGQSNPMAMDYILEDQYVPDRETTSPCSSSTDVDVEGDDSSDSQSTRLCQDNQSPGSDAAKTNAELEQRMLANGGVVVCAAHGCNRTFTTLGGLRYHIQTYDHSKARAISCTVSGCFRTYTTMAGLRYHHKTMHKIAS